MKLRGRARYEPPSDGLVIEQGLAIVVPRMTALGGRIDTNARRRVNVRTGELSSSIGHRVYRSGNRVVLRESATARHAKYVHDGTGPHEIRARNAKALRFYWPRAGRVVYFARVQHPGYKGNPFLRNAITEEIAKGV